MPFGEDLFAGARTTNSSLKYGNTDNVRQKFTGLQKDDETQQDFAGERYYSNQHGRFTAVDPLLVSGKPGNPQTFNRYAYVGGNPLKRVDPNGTTWYVKFVMVKGTTIVDYVEPVWCEKQCGHQYKWGQVYHNVDAGGGRKAKLDASWVFYSSIEQMYVAVDFFENRPNARFSNPEDAIAQLQTWNRQAALNFIMGALSGYSFTVDITGAGGLVGETGSSMYQAGERAGTALSIVAMATGAGGVINFAGSKLAKAVSKRYGSEGLAVLNALKVGCCFVAGTQIHTIDGLKPIEEIKVGDMVLSYDENTKTYEYKPVAQTFTAVKDNIVKLKIAGESKIFTTTTEHPFYVKIKKQYRARSNLSADADGEWKTAEELKVGDKVLRPDGSWTRILSISRETKPTFVYNFEVEGNHNYFVGEKGVLSHNCDVGKFLNNDIALGVHEFLGAFKGSAKIGTDFKVTTSVIDAIKGGIDDVVKNGGKIRFNLDGFRIQDALDPASKHYNSVTSQEFRYVLDNHMSSTVFYRNGQVVAP
jgi:RHS repeat-associated protein